MKFGQNETAYFDADQGAFSVVTEREATGDKSITYDLDEKQVLHSKIPADQFTRGGGAAPDGKPLDWNLQVFDSKTGGFNKQSIAIKYPKATGNELRQYFRRETSFYPSADEVAFIFTKKGDDDVYIGHMPQSDWNNIASGNKGRIAYQHDYNLDDNDADYQKAIHAPTARTDDLTVSGKKAARKAKVGADAINGAGYKCEFDANHETFISKSSSKPYMEAHHLIPMGARHDFKNSLDVPSNVISLCPSCHAKIHFSESSSRQKLILELFNQRINQLAEAGISVTLDKLYEYYNVKE